MGPPVLAEPSQGRRRQRHEAVPGPLAQMDMHEHALAVDVADLQVQAFAEAQSQGIHGPEEGLEVGLANGVDEPVHLGDGQDIGECLWLGDAHHLERLPVARHGMSVEELDAAEGDAEGAGSEPTALLEMEEVVADLLLGETIGRQSVLSGQMPDAAEIPLLGARGPAQPGPSRRASVGKVRPNREHRPREAEESSVDPFQRGKRNRLEQLCLTGGAVHLGFRRHGGSPGRKQGQR